MKSSGQCGKWREEPEADPQGPPVKKCLQKEPKKEWPVQEREPRRSCVSE